MKSKEYSNMIDLVSCLSSYTGKYCVLKMSSAFPNYVTYSDLDILCDDIEDMKRHILSFLEGVSGIKVSIDQRQEFTHIDVYRNGESRLDFKFDLVDNLQKTYNKTPVVFNLSKDIIESSVLKNGVYVPSMPYEMVVRMLEYLEYKDHRPDKIKHLNFVNYNKQRFEKEFNLLWSKLTESEELQNG